jgi:hypothetical protein
MRVTMCPGATERMGVAANVHPALSWFIWFIIGHINVEINFLYGFVLFILVFLAY